MTSVSKMAHFEKVPFDSFVFKTPCRVPIVGPTRNGRLLANKFVIMSQSKIS